MQRVHFIALGDAVVLDLAIALSEKSNFCVTVSDVEFSELSSNRLKESGLLPDMVGWGPERLTKNLNAVVLGTDVTIDNPEFIKAKELGLKVFSFPEFIFQQSRSKTRIVIAGNKGKTTITAMILFVLKQLKIDADYMIGALIDGYTNRIKLSYDSRIAIFVGDESPTSALDPRPKFHLYKPHIAVLTGIGDDYNTSFPTFEDVVLQYSTFINLMEVQGRLVYNEGDESLKSIAQKLRRDIVPFSYSTPEYEIVENQISLITKKGNIPLNISGEHDLQNLNAARIACKQIGVTDDQFYRIIGDFTNINITQ
jgi:UDP-N-acetylmuramate: L-alanyl-gamma-D-glutamyl-meso-diaminopimelate ligase